MSKRFYILSIDGGGCRGVFAAHLLTRIEQEFGVDVKSLFDLFAGTSTGAIVAAGLACGLQARTILRFYTEHAQHVFHKKLFHRNGFLASRYQNEKLRSLLDDIFCDKKLGEVEVPLILPATDVGNGCFHVFKSKYHPSFSRDADVSLKDAVLASCSAPTYFDPHVIDPYVLADGGLWANNPSLVAVIDAKHRLGQELDDLRILSIGTGINRQFYSQKGSWWKKWMGWGFFTRWGHAKFIEMLFNLQSESMNNMLGLLLDHEQILRINFGSTCSALDDPKEIKNLTSYADLEFTHRSAEIRKFLLS